ncbi:AAC(3) family N-acetyltransferase [Desulfitobacterium sp.]|uniref:aminoglycoside N(3)-acetyltransferase n=1 Tax=Desulfitobacterium sp. TaxID=49981 RepID=UPI002CF25983|nr:AAC(3) family N-acetyltransferase [Desulfitobacterium sp.]HVJ49628.1 AAC(3) family N-acetyltransferase [Desulfitobacterium sp.]
MTEEAIIKNTDFPRTRQSISKDLGGLGIQQGMTVMVHSSLSALGWVNGGAVTVIQALMDVVTASGTIVMPTHSGDYSDPALWGNPPVPGEWCPIIRETMPVFEPEVTPSRGMGTIPEVFRKWSGAVRSSHPAYSFAAWGRNAAYIVANQTIDLPLGEQSPLSRVYDLDGYVLLLGVGFGNNTSFHLAEYRSMRRKVFEAGAPVIEKGKRLWKVYKDLEYETEQFEQIGRDFEQTDFVINGIVGSANTKLFSQRKAVDFAVEWITRPVV